MAVGNAIDRAIILAAGKGSRLLPLTAERPKCLVELSGRTILEWQLESLSRAGIREIFVVTGFRPDQVEALIAGRPLGGCRVETIFNPFYHVADNLGSAWMARGAMDRDFLLLNGDTLVPPALVARLIAAPVSPITIAVDRKQAYDSDDMKVLCLGDRVVRVDKRLEEGSFNAESIGLLRFMGEGRAAFVAEAERLLRTAEGTSHFFLRAVDRLADTGLVSAASIDGLEWAEVDEPADLEVARRITAGWADAASDAGPGRAEPSA